MRCPVPAALVGPCSSSHSGCIITSDAGDETDRNWKAGAQNHKPQQYHHDGFEHGFPFYSEETNRVWYAE
jgi:hypothetical protein